MGRRGGMGCGEAHILLFLFSRPGDARMRDYGHNGAGAQSHRERSEDIDQGYQRLIEASLTAVCCVAGSAERLYSDIIVHPLVWA